MAKAQKKTTKKSKKDPLKSLDELEHVGERLKAVREANKLKLNDVAEELMIRRFYLQAIEDGNFKELPAPVYAVGFIKNYSEFLGFNADEAVADFKKEAYGTRQRTSPELVFPDPMTTNMFPTKAAIFAGAGLLAVALVLGLIFAMPDDETEKLAVSIPEAPTPVTQPVDTVAKAVTAPAPALQVTAQPSSAQPTQNQDGFLVLPETNQEKPAMVPEATVTEAQEAPVSQAQQTQDTARVVIKATQTSWVEVADGQGNIILSRVLKANETFDVPEGNNMKMITGNAGGVVIVLDGKELPRLGSVGDVRRNLSLNPDDLKKTFNLN